MSNLVKLSILLVLAIGLGAQAAPRVYQDPIEALQLHEVAVPSANLISVMDNTPKRVVYKLQDGAMIELDPKTLYWDHGRSEILTFRYVPKEAVKAYYESPDFPPLSGEKK